MLDDKLRSVYIICSNILIAPVQKACRTRQACSPLNEDFAITQFGNKDIFLFLTYIPTVVDMHRRSETINNAKVLFLC